VFLRAVTLLICFQLTLSQRIFAQQFLTTKQQTSIQPQINVGADDWPDYTAADGSGIYFNLLKKIYPEYKINFVIKGLDQSFVDFTQQKLDLVVGVYKHELNNALFPQWYLDTEFPLLAFYNKKSRHITKASDLIPLKPAWLSSYAFENFLPGTLAPIKVDFVDDGFDLIMQNKADFFIDYAYNIPKNLINKLHSIELLPAQHVYVAFQHNQNGRKLAKEFDLKMASLRNSGKLAELYGKNYFDSDLSNYVINKQKIVIYTNSVSLLNQQSIKNEKISESQTLRLMFNLLKGYEIEFKSFNNISKMYQLSKQSNVCFSDLIKTKKREENFVISQPFSMFLGLRLYSEKPISSSSSSINLETLLNSNRALKLGTVSGRSYGNNIDNTLAQIQSFQLIKSPVNIETLFKQFAKKRFDFLIEYPSFKAKNWSQSQKDTLYSYNIEGADKVVLGYMMCSKSPLGVNFIEDFNNVLEKFYHSGYFFNAQYQRVLPENKAMFIQYFNETFN
jgi:polar amino acid transport system substrate-binding protein